MSKIDKNKSKAIWEAVINLPYFTIYDLVSMEKNGKYLKVLLYRFSKQGKIKSLKRGIYVSKNFLEKVHKKNITNEYAEFIGNIIYEPSYLSMDYVLEKYSVLSESVNTFTLVSEKKTNKFSNYLGIFKFYSIKKSLFTGFNIKKMGDFFIAEATLAKALFDFLYFRKNILFSDKQVDELRLNLDNFTRKDFKELEKYINLEKSKRMKKIFDYLKIKSI